MIITWLKTLASLKDLSMEFIDGGAKVNLLTGDAVKVESDTASSADCWLSYIDSIST